MSIISSTSTRRWRQRQLYTDCCICISIHVTAKVTTIPTTSSSISTDISIHVNAKVTTHACNTLISILGISIHVTAKVTTEVLTWQARTKRFQSTSPRRWRHNSYSRLACTLWFQSTSPRRWRRQQTYEMDHSHEISIHVTAKVTTGRRLQRRTPNRHFNPRHREGDDGYENDGIFDELIFQSTSPRRWRPIVLN